MQSFNLPLKNKHTILALGAESAGNFSVYTPSSPFSKGGMGGFLYFSEDSGDLLKDTNFNKFNRELNKFLRKNKIKPDVILTDLHPLYKTTLLGQELAKKYNARHVQVQHHLAHIFSAIRENNLSPISYKLKAKSYGIALDGTGYGLDEKIWGGEVFEILSSQKLPKVQPSELRRLNLRKPQIARIGHLENQTMIGGDLAIKEPARMLISILSKFLSKDTVYGAIQNVSSGDDRHKMIRPRKTYTRNQFEVLWNQLQSGFNCQETSSTGRILDAVSIFLGFCQNERNFKHEPTILLEQNSTIPYRDLKPKIKKSTALPLWKRGLGGFEEPSITYQLDTTYLFKYLFKYVHRDKHRLAATAQLYIAEGLYEIVKKCRATSYELRDIYLAGGIANNKIISEYLISKGAIVNKEIYPVKSGKFNGVPRGDAGISFGQIIYHLFS